MSDASGTAGRTISTVTATGAVPLVPNAGGDVTGVTGTPVTLDGSGSQPSGSISSYQWSFGDDSNGTGAVVKSYVHGPGSYTATLTITANGRHSAQTQVTVVASPAPTRGLKVTVNDGSSPLSGASGCRHHRRRYPLFGNNGRQRRSRHRWPT